MANNPKLEWYRWISPVFVILTIVFGGGSIHKTIKDSNEAIQASALAIQANTECIMQNTIGIAVDVVKDVAFQKAMDLHIQQNSKLMEDMSKDIKALLIQEQ